MADWAQGYVTDLQYSLGFYRETTPNHLAFAAASVGKHPGSVLRPEKVLELGIGMGLGLVIGAAVTPHASFEGVDFNPRHVTHARGLAAAAGLRNVTIREASFQDLAREAEEGQQDLDLIVLHGILTWVSAEAHEAIIEIARKRLKPGGLLYVSYNCMPGWAPMLPLQRLMRENAKRMAAGSDQQTVSGIELLKALMAKGAAYFVNNPALAARIDRMAGLDHSYLAHEYLNADWFIFHFAEVAEMFGRAKLEFLASATLAENVDQVALPAGLRQQVAEAHDPVWQETLRDFASNKQFRRDIFARGQTTLTPQESIALLDEMRFVLVVHRDKVTFKIGTSIGEVEGRAEIYGAVADLLAEKAAGLEEITALPVFSGYRVGALQTVALLVHTGQVLPIATAEAVDPEPARRLNRILIRHMLQGRQYQYLAAPVAGSAVQVSQIELLILAAILDDNDRPADAVAREVQAAMRRLGMSPIKDGVAVTDEQEQLRLLSGDTAAVLSRKLPLWRRLGML